jgi:BirA family biotin operon repressor/biotin-[acetyl-CoA-carboxylase] ligase
LERVAPDLARADALLAERGGTLGRPLHLLATTTSTNDEAKAAARSGAPHGSTWVAEEQSAGRGRQGRTWTAARGEALLFSVLLKLECPPARLPLVSIVAGLAVRDATARALPGATVGIKWPNDVVARVEGGRARETDTHKKLSGVLVEAITAGKRVEAVVVGVGVNVHTRDFPPEIAARATSVSLLAPHAASPPDRAVLLADVLAGLDRDLYIVLRRGLGLVRARLDAADVLRGRNVTNALQGSDLVGGAGAPPAHETGGGGSPPAHETKAGVASGIDDEGRLVVRTSEGRILRWGAGEVHLGSP